LPIGDHTIATSYTPDASFLASSSTLAFAVEGIAYDSQRYQYL
jgi:hypothetical protein